MLDLVRILNFDDSITKQEKLLELFKPQIVNLKEIAPACRHWANRKISAQIKNYLHPELKNAITFLGSGDFHHISSLLIEQFTGPISIIVFDYHPDWDILPPKLGCGSWVTRTLKNSNVQKVILLGVSSGDIDASSIITGNLSSLKKDRVELYPYLHKSTRSLFRKVPDNISIRLKKTPFYNEIYWQELKNKNLNNFFLELMQRIPTKQVYVSIDKDCLKASYSLTNWEEGFFELDELLLLLGLIKEHFDIIGIDILGDYSVPEVKGIIKRMISLRDHPRDYSAKDKPQEYINKINEQTNIRILQLLKN